MGVGVALARSRSGCPGRRAKQYHCVRSREEVHRADRLDRRLRQVGVRQPVRSILNADLRAIKVNISDLDATIHEGGVSYRYALVEGREEMSANTTSTYTSTEQAGERRRSTNTGPEDAQQTPTRLAASSSTWVARGVCHQRVFQCDKCHQQQQQLLTGSFVL